jgi:hypothetical protein
VFSGFVFDKFSALGVLAKKSVTHGHGIGAEFRIWSLYQALKEISTHHPVAANIRVGQCPERFHNGHL